MSHFYTINGIIYDENDKEVDIEEYGDDEYKQFKDEFEDKSYLRLCIEQPLNTIISYEENIILYDNRSDCYEYYNLPDYEKQKYINYLRIKKDPDEYITLKTVLKAIMNDYFYSNDNKEIYRYLNHIFLESFSNDKENSIQFEVFLGS